MEKYLNSRVSFQIASHRYNRDRRDAAAAATRERIVQAAAELHAEIGPGRTTYAMIAERADVAAPTVYRYLPTPAQLFAARLGHIVGQAPPLGPEIFADWGDSATRLQALVRALCARYQFLAPWLRWEADEATLPELAAHRKRMRDGRLELISGAITPSFGPRPPPTLIGLLDALLDFRAWEGLTVGQKLTDEEAAKAIIAAAEALLSEYARPSQDPGVTPRRHLARRRPS